jgi:hypothetical protein
MQATESAILLRNLASLSDGFSQLGTRLSQAANVLQSTGMPPAKTLIDEITTSRNSFTELCAKSVALAEALALSPAPKPESIVSLNDLKSLLQTITQAEEKRKAVQELSQRALATLDRLYAIRHREREVFPPLAECQMRGTVLRNAIAETPWPKLHPSAEELTKGDNPFVALLTLIEQGEKLEDEQCVRLQEIVERAFSKSLASAALRGKLSLLADDASVREIRTISPTQPAVKTERSSNSSGSMRPVFESSPIDLFTGPVPKVESEKQPPVFSEVRTGSKEGRLEVPRAGGSSRSFFEASGEVDSSSFPDEQNGMVAVKVEAPSAREAGQFRKVTQAREGRSVTHPTSAMNNDSGTLAMAPVSDTSEVQDDPILIPSAAPTSTDYESKATGAGSVVDVLYRCEADDKAQKIASMLLTGAYGLVEEKPAFLRDLVWRLIFEEKLSVAFHVARCIEIQHPEFFPRLPSWLLRAVVLGQRVRNPQGDIARLLKDDFARCDTDCHTTGDKEWDLAVEFLLLAGAFLPALIAPETRASTILHGVCLDGGLDHLSAYCNVIALYGDLLVPLDPMTLKKPGRAQTKESVGFMRRLIGNQENGARKDVVSEQIEPLRVEISNRQQAVIDELNLFKTVQSSVAVLGSLACCRRAIENVALLIDPETPFSFDEPLPRPLLNVDLSRIPTLVLNKQGEVEGIDQPAFLESLLRLIASGSLKMI